ncbi:D-glycero-beta-D-manno-heptose-7-phosphate kinase [Candidatus Roizmanbacteria bacterium]|nr:D-glycero-beta-D-manno-heptose-7-phosphate kinase [Candidatus Roizmanbacteria bacterium]
MNKQRLLEIVDNFAKQKILVIGDLILDSYLWTTVERISPEAPVPVAKVDYEKRETFILGGAANTAHNLSALGVKTFVSGIVGDDENGKKLKRLLKEAKVNVDFVIEDKDRPTTIKTRVMAGIQQLLRIDQESSDKIKSKIEDNILNKIKKLTRDLKTIIISDYDKGFLTDGLVKEMFRLAKKNQIKIFADPTPTTFYKYKNCYLVKPNKKEAENMVHKRIYDDNSNLKEICLEVKKILKPRTLLITLGKEGMVILDEESRFHHIKTKTKQVFDVSGAGDTTIAVFACCITAGTTLEEAAEISNIASGIVVSKLGTAVCTKKELIDSIMSS